MSTTLSKRLHEALMIIVSAPVVGLLMGGLYSYPAIKITRGRDPWLTLLLAAGLSITVFVIGSVTCQPWQRLATVLSAAILGLIAMRSLFGSFNGNLERFGLIHTTTLILLAIVLLQGKVRGRQHGAAQPAVERDGPTPRGSTPGRWADQRREGECG